MNQSLLQKAQIYAAQHQLIPAEQLGTGVHGIVVIAENNTKPGKTAIKVHCGAEAFLREVAAYERLREAEISEILGFHVPQLVGVDAQMLVIQMTVVVRPFVLDFAGAYLDFPPDFPQEVWDQWEADKREQFGDRWPTVLEILGFLEQLDIYMVDVSPGNIAFVE